MNRIGFFLLVTSAFLAGCGKSTTVTDLEGGKVTVRKKGDDVEISVKGKDGETFSMAGSDSGVSLPESFPGDVPVYPGATVVASATMKEVTNVTLKTSDKLDAVKKFYDEKLKAGAWQIVSTVNTPQGTMIQATKGDASLTVVVGQEDDGTIINLAVTSQKD